MILQRVLLRARSMSHEAFFVNFSLVLAFDKLKLTDHAWSIDRRLDTLMVVNKRPKDCSGLCLHFWVLVMLGKEGHQTRKEVVIFQEMNFVLSIVACRISDEKQDLVNQWIDWRKVEIALRYTRIWNCWNVHSVKEEECKLKRLLDLQNLSRTLFSGSETAEERHKVQEIEFLQLDVFVILALRNDLTLHTYIYTYINCW